MMIELGVWRDTGAYIPGYGRVRVVDLVDGQVVFLATIGLDAAMERREMPVEEFKQRFRRVS